MSYRDPYAAGQYGASRHTSPPPQQQYNEDFNPYANSRQPYETYDRGANIDPSTSYGNYADGPTRYQDEPFSHTDIAGRQNISDATVAPKERSTFDHDEYGQTPLRKDQSARALREYRLMSQGGLWTRGGGFRTFCRFFFCTVFIALFLILGVILSLALWLRPPNITIGDVDSSSMTTSFSTGGITIGLPVNISINNPNYVGVDLQKLTAEVYYPINNTAVGGGVLTDIKIISNGQTNFTFPFGIDYKTSLDTNGKILADLLVKCSASPKQDIKVDYKITLDLKIIATTIRPSVSNSLTFACPIDASALSGLGSSKTRDLTVEKELLEREDVPPGMA